MKLVFWSPAPFAGRKSANLTALVLTCLLKRGGEHLVLHADANGSGPEHLLLDRAGRVLMEEKKEFGLCMLERMLCCERFEKDLLINASYTFADGALQVLPAGREAFFEEREEEALRLILGVAQRSEELFDTVWIEAPAGEGVIADGLRAAADIVVINSAQSLFFAKGRKPVGAAFLKKEREFLLLGAYESRLRYNLHNLKQLYPVLSGRSVGIPYEPGFLEACLRGSVCSYFYKNQGKEKGETGYEFFKAVERAEEELYRLARERRSVGPSAAGGNPA